MSIGYRLSTAQPKYIKHPPGNGTHWESNGYPLDSGTAMILSNNWAHLDYQNLHELVNWTGHTNATSKNTNNGFTLVSDLGFVPATGSAEPINRQIPWGLRNNSRRFGPFFIPVDKYLPDGRETIRDIQCFLSFYNPIATSSSSFYVFTTDSAMSPRDGYLGYYTFGSAVAGYLSQSFTLTCSNAVYEDAAVMSRPVGEPVFTKCVYLWLGWAFQQDDTAELTGFFAHESR